jgi:uncharacterized membrane protein YdcZ (DUF606 family)
LGQLADEKAEAPNDPQSPNGLIDAQMPSLKTRISHWLQMPLTPVFAGLLFGFLVLLTLWKTKKRDEDHHGNADGVDPRVVRAPFLTWTPPSQAVFARDPPL